mmetsp:Transcript_5011/g.9459  ORF Transcript_5011/g.9459 Transcript_5011/m.9459 type:complete len:208 (+) Transcript_5011:1167-1790(+)
MVIREIVAEASQQSAEAQRIDAPRSSTFPGQLLEDGHGRHVSPAVHGVSNPSEELPHPFLLSALWSIGLCAGGQSGPQLLQHYHAVAVGVQPRKEAGRLLVRGAHLHLREPEQEVLSSQGALSPGVKVVESQLHTLQTLGHQPSHEATQHRLKLCICHHSSTPKSSLLLLSGGRRTPPGDWSAALGRPRRVEVRPADGKLQSAHCGA